MPKPPWRWICATICFTLTRVLVSSMAVMSIATSGPSTCRSAASADSVYITASELDGMDERSHCTT